MDDDNKLDAAHRIEALNSALEALSNDEPLRGFPALATVFAIKRELHRIESIDRKGRKPRKLYGVFTPEFEVAMKYETGAISYEDATQQLCDICSCVERTAQRHLAEMVPRAKEMLPLFQKD